MQKSNKMVLYLSQSAFPDRFFMIRTGYLRFIAIFKGNILQTYFEVLRKPKKSSFGSRKHFRRQIHFYEGFDTDLNKDQSRLWPIRYLEGIYKSGMSIWLEDIL